MGYFKFLTAPIKQSASQLFGIQITLITLDEPSCMETAPLNPGFFFHINQLNHA
jgi:hypothetical protein